LWIGDLVDLYERILEAPELAVGETFVTGPDNGLTIRDLAHLIRAKLDWQGTINWHTIPKRPGEIYYLCSRADKAEKVLGWTPKVSLSEGLDRTIAIWRDRSSASYAPPAAGRTACAAWSNPPGKPPRARSRSCSMWTTTTISPRRPPPTSTPALSSATASSCPRCGTSSPSTPPATSSCSA